MSITMVLARLVAAVLIGSVVGLNRDLNRKPAGLRTHALVALGAALVTITSLQVAVPSDTSGALRVVQGIITGIGFLGAGVILHPNNEKGVLGLTTAASIWVVAGLGIACGAGSWGTALVASGLVMSILVLGGVIERAVERSFSAGIDRWNDRSSR